MMKRRVVMAARWCALSGILFSLGCATATLPQRYPSRPPSGMTAAQAELDERACLDVAKQATVERSWAYIGCMVSKGHSVGVAFRARGETYFFVTQTRPHDGATVASELDECRRTAYDAGRSGGGGHEAMIGRMETSFRGCVGPRGYSVQPQGALPAARSPR